MALRAMAVATEDFDSGFVVEAFDLYASYYAPVDFDRFRRDLKAKSAAIVLRDEEGRLRGFSTVARFGFLTPQGPVAGLFSGDTVIHRACWGEQALPFAWIEHAGRIKAAEPETPLYWLLITKGHRTFRYLPAFACGYWPGTDASLKPLADRIAAERFGALYDAKRGVVRPDPACPTALRPEYRGLEPERISNPHIQFFLAQNPGHAAGEELVCLCELSADNLRPWARRQFLKGMA